MMLDHFGHADAGKAIIRAIENVLSSPNAPLTPDLGGTSTTQELGSAIAAAI